MYPPELINNSKNFWFAFDNRYFLQDADKEHVTQLFLDSNFLIPNPAGNPRPNFDWMFFRLKEKINTDPFNYEQLFLTEISKYENGIRALAADQIGVVNQYLKEPKEIQEAFELFGQGVLYDERDENVHKMDGDFPHDFVGYRRWHGFARAALLIVEEYDFWLNLDRSLLLAYLIQAELRPLATIPNNPFMDESRLREYESQCMALEPAAIDKAFNTYFPNI